MFLESFRLSHFKGDKTKKTEGAFFFSLLSNKFLLSSPELVSLFLGTEKTVVTGAQPSAAQVCMNFDISNY